MTDLDLDIDLDFDDEAYDHLESSGELTIDLGEGVHYDVDADGEGEIIVQFWRDE